jgi:hypothetical protein
MLKKMPFKEASIGVYGRNLWIIYTKIKNVDPESNYTSSNGQGFEFGSLPSRRTYGVNINIKF